MRSTILFSTLALTAASGLLSLGCDDAIRRGGGNDTETNPLSGEPDISILTTEIDFGDVSYGQNASESVTVENVGGADLTLTSIAATSPFTTSYTSSVVIGANSSQSLTVRYQPSEYADHTGVLTILCDDPDTGEASFEIPLYAHVITDEDGDGVDCEDAGGDDCDDDDAEVYPDAEEEWYDGTDQNCDGEDDYDQDGDFYQEISYNGKASNGGGDCNDANKDIYPGAPDDWYDTVDSTCDGESDWDQDNDGYDTTLGDHGTDCDDTDGNINPGVKEDTSKTPKVDDDCDGYIDEDD